MIFVVDANIARSAGGMSSPPPSPHCFRTLSILQNQKHSFAFNVTLYEEWKKHASHYAKTVLARAIRERKVVHYSDNHPIASRLYDLYNITPKEILDHSICPATYEQLQAINKDIHLFDLSLLSNRRIISMDERLKNIIFGYIHYLTDLQRVHWFDPRQDPALAWLERGAPEDPSLHLLRAGDSG